MIARTAAALAEHTGGVLHGADQPFEAVTTDSRALSMGDCFFALSGPRFDAHDFLPEVAARGAAVAVVARDSAEAVAQVRVADTLAALQAWAAAWRAALSMPLVGITGSNGKTTLRAMLEAVLAPLGSLLATRGNLNNHIGLPLTLCRLRDTHAVAVIEMGANHRGEIAQLAAMARPDVGIVTNAGDAHLEGFGSREGVAHGKGELFAALPEDGTAIINADDAYAGLWTDMSRTRRVLRFGLSDDADVRARGIVQSVAGSRFELILPGDSVPVRLPLPGRHNVRNALAAAAAGHTLGLDAATIAAGLATTRAPDGRLAALPARGGARLIDDSYNANPDSLAAAIDWLAGVPGQRVLALGDMAELGAAGPDLHAQAGKQARAAGIDVLLAVGPLAARAAEAYGEGGEVFDTPEALAAALAPRLTSGWTVLVKGSRSAGMESVVGALRDDKNTTGEANALSPD